MLTNRKEVYAEVKDDKETLRLVTWVRKPCGWNVGLIHKKTSRREGGRSQRLTKGCLGKVKLCRRNRMGEHSPCLQKWGS